MRSNQQIKTTAALALALSAIGASTASARFELNPTKGASAPPTYAARAALANPDEQTAPAVAASQRSVSRQGIGSTSTLCSEACSGGGYGSVSKPFGTLDDLGAALAHDPRARSVALSGSYNTASNPPTVVRVVTHAGGFDWGDAGIGAGGMLALTLIGLGGALTATRRRNHRIHHQHAN
jgi:hypothetical protein